MLKRFVLHRLVLELIKSFIKKVLSNALLEFYLKKCVYFV